VREHATPAAFRAAIEAQLRDRAHRLGIPAYIVRRQAALERLMVRLARVASGRWAVKGGMALETRLGARARVSVDLDADHILGGDAARADLQRATVDDVDDHFAFALVSSDALREAGVGLAVRYGLESSLAGRPFEPVQVDVTTAPPDVWDAQAAQRPGLLTDLGLDPIDLLLVPLERQVGEKLHACTRTYNGGGTTRVRDLIDLLLIREYAESEPAALCDAILRVFDRRATHLVPERLPPPPRALGVAYRREAARVGLVTSLDEAHRVLADWLDPVLAEIHRPGNRGKRPDDTQ
jgi:hypothetical protein